MKSEGGLIQNVNPRFSHQTKKGTIMIPINTIAQGILLGTGLIIAAALMKYLFHVGLC